MEGMAGMASMAGMDAIDSTDSMADHLFTESQNPINVIHLTPKYLLSYIVLLSSHVIQVLAVNGSRPKTRQLLAIKRNAVGSND